MDRDIIAVVTAKHDDLENISKTGWNPSIEAVVVVGDSHIEDNQVAPQHSSTKKPSNRIFNLSPLLKDKDAKGSTPQQGLGTKKGPLKRFMVSVNTRQDDKSVGRPILQNGIPVICDVQAPKAFWKIPPENLEKFLTTYVKACWWAHYKTSVWYIPNFV